MSDFGIAKVVGGAESMGTRTGEVLGTPAYMAPEQALGTELTPATDVYALGTVLYELLSGRLPFSDEGNAIALLYRHVHEDPTPLAELRPDLAPELVEVTMRSLARDPADRYETAEDFGVALAQAANAAWGRGWVRAGGVTVVASGRIGEYLTGPGPGEAPSTETVDLDAAAAAASATGAAPASSPDRITRSTRASVTVADHPHPGDPAADQPASPDQLIPLSEVVEAEGPPPAPPTEAAAPPPTAAPRPPTGGCPLVELASAGAPGGGATRAADAGCARAGRARPAAVGIRSTMAADRCRGRGGGGPGGRLRR